MIWEHSIRLKKLASCSISSKRLQNFIYKETTGAVSAINYNVKTAQRLITFAKTCQTISNFSAQIISINSKQIQFFNRSIHLCRIQKACKVQNLCNIFVLKTTVNIKKFNSISVERKMAGCNHCRTIKVCFRENNRHEHCRSCRHTTVYNCSTSANHSFNKSLSQSRSCYT